MNKPKLPKDLEIRHAQPEDLVEIQSIFGFARQQMRNQGNMSQWPTGYPSDEKLLEDMAHKHLFACTVDNEICGVFALIFGEDPTYRVIEQGQWLNDLPYATLHRVASNGLVQGLGRFILNWSLERAQNLRVDTHADNAAMLHLLRAMKFTECGIIYVADGTPRLAFQKSL